MVHSMFNPNFRYTNKIMRLLTKISAIRSAHSSTRIEGNRLSLTERQMQIVEFINTAGKITSGDLQRLFKISRQAAHKEIKALVELGVIKSQGERKSDILCSGLS